MKQVYWLLAKQFVIITLIVSIFVIFPFYGAFLFLFSMTGVSPVLSVFATAILLVIFGSIGDFCTGSLREKLVQANILDNPNLRSMHTQPVPRGGGWVFVLPLTVFFLCVVAAEQLSNAPSYFYGTHRLATLHKDTVLFIGFLLVVIVSWVDDRKNIAVRWRLLAQFAATLPVIYCSWPFLDSILPSWTPEPAAFIILLLLWIGFINLYNFMDGIDGITATQTISIGFPIFLILLPLRATLLESDVGVTYPLIFVPLVGLLTTGVSLGFYYHNWYMAKIFLGDIGSVTLGYVMGFCLLSVAGAGFWYVALTLPLYYLADGGITLARRILRGEKFWEAHRTHFYQRAAQAAGRHDVVVLKIAACNVVLIGIAMLELLVSPWFVLAAPLPVALLLHNMAHQRHIGVKSPNG